MDDVTRFERAVLAQAPPGSVLVSGSLSPDGHYYVAFTILPSANNYPMHDVFELGDDGWVLMYGSNGGGITWSRLTDEGLGVLTLDGEALSGSSVDRVSFSGRGHEVPVRSGHFQFVALDVPEAYGDPVLIAFE
jgi:hypothetical protein